MYKYQLEGGEGGREGGREGEERGEEEWEGGREGDIFSSKKQSLDWHDVQ